MAHFKYLIYLGQISYQLKFEKKIDFFLKLLYMNSGSRRRDAPMWCSGNHISFSR